MSGCRSLAVHVTLLFSKSPPDAAVCSSISTFYPPIRTTAAPGWPSGGRCGFLFSLLFQLRRLRARFSHICFNGYRTVSTSYLREGAVRAAKRGLTAENKVTSAVQYCSRLRAKKLLRTDDLWIPKKDGGKEIVLSGIYETRSHTGSLLLHSMCCT